jgi:hypothetical protein
MKVVAWYFNPLKILFNLDNLFFLCGDEICFFLVLACPISIRLTIFELSQRANVMQNMIS